MADQNTAVEQLWYTWSDVGIDTIRAGFRIRAASEGLQDIRSLRVQHLDRYQRYSLPQDVNPVTIELDMAPICLSLIATGQERILVHKAYSGKDGVGRYGSFFIHLLAGLPDEFTAIDAIALWRSPFWQVSDVTLEDRHTTSLKSVSLKQLRAMRKDVSLTPQGAAKIHKYLPYVIQAYLTKKPFIDKKTTQTIPQKLYIAASDDEVALLISGLTHCLPEQLLKGLTFSTYEHDVTKATTEIIGTCWLSPPSPEQDSHVAHLLPAQYYQEKLAINCYTGVCSPLENNRLLFCKPLAAQFAQDATEYLLHRSTEFKDLLETARYYPNLDVDEFLNLYESMIVRAENPSDSNIDSVLIPRTRSNFAYSEKMLSRRGYQTALINRAIRDPKWWWTPGRAAIIKLREQSAKMPMLAQALSQTAQRAIPWAVNNAREGVPLAKATTPRKVITNEEATFTITVDVMHCAAPPQVDPEVWSSLLWELLTIDDVFVFLNNYSNTRGYHPFIEDLLQQLSQDTQRWPTAEALFDKLAAGKHGKKLHLLFILLNSAIGKYEENVERLLRVARLATNEKAAFLERYGPQYLPLSNRVSDIVLKIFYELAKNDIHKEKMHILFSWLESSQLSDWFDSSPNGEKHLAMVLDAAQLSVEESGEFLNRYGQKYFRLYPTSSTLWNLFGRYDKSGTQPRLTFIWLNPQLDQKTLEYALQFVHFTAVEMVMFLELYGELYISRYPRSWVLLKYVEKYLEYLWTIDIDLFQRSSSPVDPSSTERFLRFLCQSSLQLPTPSRQLVCAWSVVGAFVRNPSLQKGQGEEVAGSIGRLLGVQNVPQATHEKLIEKFAVACIEDGIELSSLINTLCGAFIAIPRDLLLLLYDIAESARNGIRGRRYTEPLFVTCIQFALSFKTVFYEEVAQKSFVQLFLDTLLLYTDRKTFNWLDIEAKRWPSGAYAEWQTYEPQYLLSAAVVEPSHIERMKLWWEHGVAFTHMRRALRRKKKDWVVQVYMDYMTTLNRYDKEVPDEWWRELDTALRSLNTYEEAKWQQYDYQRNQKPAVPSPAGNPPLFNRMKLWWKHTVAFTQMQMALGSKKIGRIVRVATDHMITLDTYHEKVPADWWRQIDAAFDFFIACEDADESGDEAGEQAIISANNKIDALVSSGLPAPKLTMHEKRRNEDAKQYVAYLNIKRMKAAMLSLSTARMGQAMALTPHAISAKKPKRRFFGWFKK